jgi:glycosyltransferase involved in cell wall biosynthesis
MKKVLLVGEHPQGSSGNSHMMNAVLQQINFEKHDISVFATTYTGAPVVAQNYYLFEGGANPVDDFGSVQLINFLDRNVYEIIIFIGIDLWRFAKVMPQLKRLRERDKFLWVSIFPCDIHEVTQDFLDLLSDVDIPCVYSEYGFNLLRERVPNLCYFRPPLFCADKFVPYSKEQKERIRRNLFKEMVDDETFIFGFFGHNQFRKDPLRLIKVFFVLKQQFPNIRLYLHTDLKQGVFNIEQYIRECGGKYGDILVKKQNHVYSVPALVEAYNACDCLINVSLQEGLSWTLLEAMLCGVPVIAANNTAQIELLRDGAGMGIPSTDLAYIPVLSGSGESTFVESKAVCVPTLLYGMRSVMKESVRNNLIKNGFKRAKEWLGGITDIQDLFEKAYKYERKGIQILSKDKIEKVVFAQHSAAGDVFMTTRCFEDIKKRHPDLPFVYMTQKKYQDIIKGNPFIDEIVNWDPEELQRYKIVYNPHGERILPGHWGRNSNSLLSDFYWKVLMIEKPGDFFIEKKRPLEDIAQLIEINEYPVCILHSTGGDPEFRTYKYLADVAEGLPYYTTIQLGGKDDYPAGADIDLRGKLSFRETAWVVQRAKIAVTVDSFMSHLCGALGTSQVCLFGSGNHFVVRPNQLSGKLICMTPDYVKYCKGLGPCSAAVRDCPIKCTGIHDPNTILENIKEIEEGL